MLLMFTRTYVFVTINYRLNLKVVFFMIKVAAVDDNVNILNLVRAALSHEPGITLVWTATSKEEAMEKVKKDSDIDVILMDINLSENSLEYEGLDTIIELSQYTEAKFIIFSGLSREELIEKAYYVCVLPFLHKFNIKNLIPTIKHVNSIATACEKVFRELLRLKRLEILSQLTDEEKQIVEFWRSGKDREEILRLIHESESTYKRSRRKILDKLNARSIEEAIRKIKRLFM